MSIAAVVGVLLTGRLGFWQLDRAAQKIERQRSFDERSALPELLEAQWPANGADVSPVVNRRVHLRGEWLTKFTVFLDNRPMDGRQGFYVVTPLKLSSNGRVIAVQRGWSPRAFDDRTRLQPLTTPTGVVDIEGRIAPAPGRLYDLGGPASGVIRQNLDLPLYAAETNGPMAGWTVVQDEAGDAHTNPTSNDAGASTDDLLRHWPRPALDVQRNYGYAFQWFALCGLMAVLYVWFQLIRPRLKRAA